MARQSGGDFHAAKIDFTPIFQAFCRSTPILQVLSLHRNFAADCGSTGPIPVVFR
jgi:hypothetical protein